MKRACFLLALAWLLALPAHAQPELFELRGRAAAIRAALPCREWS